MTDSSDQASAGWVSPYDTNHPYNTHHFWTRQHLAKLRTNVMVKVLAVNAGQHPYSYTVDVQPMVNQVDGQGNSQAHGTIYGIPMFSASGGNGAVVVKPKVGDMGLMAVQDRDTSAAIAANGQANPGSSRVHSLSDGIYLGGFGNLNSTQGYTVQDENGITINSPQAATITAQGAPVSITASHGVNITGNTSVTGNISATGTVTGGGAGVGTGTAWVTQYGTVLDGVTDDSAAINSALSSGVPCIWGPAGKTAYCASAITIPAGVTLQGFGFIGVTNITPTPGFNLLFANSVATCVTMSGSGGTISCGLRGVTIRRTGGTPPGSSVGLYVSNGYNPIIEDVAVVNHAINLVMDGTGGGISCSPLRLYTAAANDAHILLNDWPEFRMSQCRIGSNVGSGGAIDYANINAYVRLTGSGSNPNTIYISNCQFNQGGSGGAQYVGTFLDFLNDSSTQTILGVSDTHIENANYIIQSDSNLTVMDRVAFVNCDFRHLNSGTHEFWNLNSATSVNYFKMAACDIATHTFTLPSGQGFYQMLVSDTFFGGAVSITGNSTSRIISLANCSFTGLTVAGSFGLASFGGSLTTGATVTNTATTPVEFSFPGSAQEWTSFTPAIAFGGGNTGITYSKQFGRYKVIGSNILCQMHIIMTAVGSSTGNATITGLPFTVNESNAAAGDGNVIPQYSGMSGLTGPMAVSPSNSSATANINMLGGATGSGSVTNSNFTSSSNFQVQFMYPIN